LNRLLLIVVLGACPDPAFPQTPTAAPRAPRHEDPFERFKDLPPDPPPLLPVERAWFVSMPDAPAAPGAIDAHRVYIPLRNAWMMALDRETGKMAWRREIDAHSSPIVRDDTVFIASRGSIRALDAASGADRWTAPIDSDITAPLVWDSGWLFVVAKPGTVIALRASDGREIWRRSLGSESEHPPAPGGKGGLYLSLMDGRVIGLRTTDGSIIWEQKVPGTLSEPAVAPDRVYVGSTDNFFYAFEAESGKLAWKWRGGGDVIGATYDGDLVYFASLDNIIRAVNPGNGNQRWKKETGTRPVLPPQAFGGILVLPGLSPAVTVFVAKTGAVMATHTALAPDGSAQALIGPPLFDGEIKPLRVALVTITRDGLVEGLRPTGMMFREVAPTPLAALPGRVLTREAKP
jgi:outer membrane protein assembly factor BamB